MGARRYNDQIVVNRSNSMPDFAVRAPTTKVYEIVILFRDNAYRGAWCE
jgi:hypothetical protein